MAEVRRAILAGVLERGADTRSLFLDVPDGLSFLPGQFVSCLLPIGGERLIRPYTIASDPERTDRIELLLDRVPDGPGSGYLFGLSPGAGLDFTGPWGTFTLARAPAAEAVFVALGTGIAAIRPMLRRAAATATRPLRLVHASDPPLYLDELAALPGVEAGVVPPAEVEALIRSRYVDADAERGRHFFVCGVGSPVTRLRDLLREAGYARRAVQYEKW